MTFDQWIDSIVAQQTWHDDLTPDEIEIEKAAMRERVVADVLRTIPAEVLARYKANGVPEANIVDEG